ncbi:MAG: hypothetical protein R3F11_03635 [Verrucomicrobiales bacterium]
MPRQFTTKAAAIAADTTTAAAATTAAADTTGRPPPSRRAQLLVDRLGILPITWSNGEAAHSHADFRRTPRQGVPTMGAWAQATHHRRPIAC